MRTTKIIPFAASILAIALASPALASVEIKGVETCTMTLKPVTVNGVSNQKITLKGLRSYVDSKLPPGQNNVTFQSGSYSCKTAKLYGNFKLQQSVTLSDAAGKPNFAKFEIYMNHKVTVTTGNTF